MSAGKVYDFEYKIQAIKLANEIGQAKAAAELGISKNTIYTWIRIVRLGRLNLGEGIQYHFGVKKRLESIRENVREGIVETDQTLARIDGFGEGMRMANQQLANSFRVLAGKEQVDYSKKEYAQSNVAVIRKPWEWQKKVYQNLELHLDAAIDKVDNLAKDVELQKMEKKWDELYEQTHQESKETAQPQTIALVSEKDYSYGAEAFEAYMEESNRDIKSDIKEVALQKSGKAR